MFTNCISQKAQRIFEKLAETRICDPFYLAGGTALALQIGHRLSFDLDFFSSKAFNVKMLQRNLAKIGVLRVTLEDPESLCVEMNGVKMSFLHYPYRVLFRPLHWRGNGSLADIRDIACMKIDAISSRGTKRDFVDLYYLLRRFSLPQLLGFYKRKYRTVQYNSLHIVKSLVYFEDAEDEPMPLQTEQVTWNVMKRKIRAQVNSLHEAAFS